MGSSISALLFQPPNSSYDDDEADFMKLYTRRGSTIAAFHNDVGAQQTILFSHGNAEDIGLIFPWFCEVARILRVNVLAYDYTGYGNNNLQPSEEDCYADIDAAFSYLTVVKGISPRNIILWGRSLGSGPTCYLAEKQSKKAGVILQSPLMSVYRVAFHFRFSLPGDMFCNIDRVSNICCPIMIVHGTRDEIVPFWHGQELYLATQEKFRYEPYWATDVGHNNIEVAVTKLLFARLRDFFKFTSLVPFGSEPSA
ncbi:Monoacylglycerol lipase ABHD12 [Hondaea fermentalgiana]|uniref:Monoacylglycerol lipase ABHD12 n=1 Tax=Hondaea fermentalgiana TaxID=2315210 RepID=A0A2R5G6M8_9STRA|nr:Monoacylglycerol lipase ABHD12 [Hondaea fermentalgiana]|eukprot:GBG26185.1 Monoacylglycerol lipase ABHD12 [Hondaea fermentalgiana]